MKIELMRECMIDINNSELDIEILNRDNEKLCADNNNKIEDLRENIRLSEIALEEGLKKSGETKLTCKFANFIGLMSFKKQPDEWKYDDDLLIAWVTPISETIKELFLKVTTTLKKGDLKKHIIDYNDGLFKDGKIIKEYLNTLVAGDELFLHTKEKDYRIPGIKIKRQDPKFSYTIKKK